MDLNVQTLINAGMATGFAVAGWFAREMWSAVKELKSDLAKLREEIPTHYIAKEDFRNGLREVKETLSGELSDIKKMINRLFDKIDGKQDKP